jgi:ribosome biogenesis GTPase
MTVCRSGLVIRGSRGVFTIRLEGGEGEKDYRECRIKGKILRGEDSYQNPLAPGDRVTAEFGEDPQGLITGLLERRSIFGRQKALGAGRASARILAANADLILVVTSPCSPPFRPRFLDRVLIQAEAQGIAAAVVCNKLDLSGGAPAEDCPWLDVEERLEDFRRIGYPVLQVSAKTGQGMAALRDLIRGRKTVMVGQSGVGKSSIVNALTPEAAARVGRLNGKYDRGNHTTTLAEIIEVPGAAEGGETWLIDTPGIRRFVPCGVEPGDLALHMREFAPLAGRCSYGLSCTHRSEPGCKILEAVAAGIIHEDRYDSFLRISGELAEDRD